MTETELEQLRSTLEVSPATLGCHPHWTARRGAEQLLTAAATHILSQIAYQSRSWSVSARSEARLKHAVAVARVLAELRMEVSAVSAALLAGVCEDAGITYTQIESRCLMCPTTCIALIAAELSAMAATSEVFRVAR